MPRPTLDVLENLMRYTSVRQKVIAKNIANSDTELYQRQEVNFDKFLGDAMNTPFNTTNEKHFSTGASDLSNGVITTDSSTTDTSGVNNVMVDREMADLAQNTLLFKFGASRLSSHFKLLQEVIKGGK